MVNNVIGMVNYVIAARPSLRNFMIADNICKASSQEVALWRYEGLGCGECGRQTRVDDFRKPEITGKLAAVRAWSAPAKC
jgi:hypothetical protein